ncbi:MAG: aldo/keto reductase [Eubacteriales bacterium]|nr:aldo/keto reductase [Eubacteriales bacterium]
MYLTGTKKLGFGCMRLPMRKDAPEQVDTDELCAMIDRFLSEGFCYFDTAHGYTDGKSELALRECLTSRYPRDAYVLTNKLTSKFFNSEDDIRSVFAQQLENVGVDYFDFYLMHSLTSYWYPNFVKNHAFDIAKELKAAGKIRHIGISFHDKPALLKQILEDHPEIEVVQIQFNYADEYSPSIESRALYDVCVAYGKPVIVMEPVKGGSLAQLLPDCAQILDKLHGGSYASYALRYAASFQQVGMVLSGMSNMEQMEDNISFMRDFKPLDQREMEALAQVRERLNQHDLIACTACRYCTDECPKQIPIPDLFACYNSNQQFRGWNSDFYYTNNTAGRGKASDCIHCGSCEHHCPQHLPIRQYLEQVAALFEKKKETP